MTEHSRHSAESDRLHSGGPRDVMAELLAEVGSHVPDPIAAGIDGDYIDSANRPSREIGWSFDSDAAW